MSRCRSRSCRLAVLDPADEVRPDDDRPAGAEALEALWDRRRAWVDLDREDDVGPDELVRRTGRVDAVDEEGDRAHLPAHPPVDRGLAGADERSGVDHDARRVAHDVARAGRVPAVDLLRREEGADAALLALVEAVLDQPGHPRALLDPRLAQPGHDLRQAD